MTPIRLLICGGRDFDDAAMVFRHLDAIRANKGVACIISGGARGADWLAVHWAELRGIPCREYPADWKTHGRKAGPIRNTRMLVEGKPDAILAFPGGRGTADMVRQAMRIGLPGWRVTSVGMLGAVR